MTKLTDEDESSLLFLCSTIVQAHVISHMAHARTILIQTFTWLIIHTVNNCLKHFIAATKVKEIFKTGKGNYVQNREKI